MNAQIMGAKGDHFTSTVVRDKSVGTYVYDGSLVMGNLMNAAHGMQLLDPQAKEEFESQEGRNF